MQFEKFRRRYCKERVPEVSRERSGFFTEFKHQRGGTSIMEMKRMILSGVCFIALGFGCASASDLAGLVNARSVDAEASAAGGGDSAGSLITPDGKYVLFASTANNLVTNTNGA